MAISVNWPNKIISVPQADLTPLGGNVYELDVNVLRLELKALEDDEGMPFLDTHRHNTLVTIGGVTLARVVEIINGYTITFEDGQYAVNIVGANSNISDVANVNQVSIRSANSAGMVETGISGLTAQESANLAGAASDAAVAKAEASRARKWITNREDLSESGPDNRIIYDDDGVTPLETQTVADKDDNDLVIESGAPAKRSAPS